MEVTRTVEHVTHRGTTEETVYAITSLGPEQAGEHELLWLLRRHWKVEAVHWIRDVTYDEDRSRVHTKNAPRAMATLRNLAISLVHLWGYRTVAQGTRRLRTKPALAIERLGLAL